MDAEYTATADLEEGQQVTVKGNIMECANWAENVIRANGGSINIQITRVEQPKGA